MAVYRGIGGAGDSVDDATISAVAALAAQAATSAAEADADAATASAAASAATAAAEAVLPQVEPILAAAVTASNSATLAAISAANAAASASIIDPTTYVKRAGDTLTGALALDSSQVAGGVVYLDGGKRLVSSAQLTASSVGLTMLELNVSTFASFGADVLQIGDQSTTDGPNPSFYLTRKNDWGFPQKVKFQADSISGLSYGAGLTISSKTSSSVYQDRYKIFADGSAQTWSLGASEQMRLTSTGLGIGTTNPSGYSAKLAVVGNIAAISGGTFLCLDSTNSYYYQIGASGDALTFNKVGVGERMRLDASGNLGLGVTPSAWNTVKAFEIGAPGNALSSGGVQAYLTSNAYYATGWKYGQTGIATKMEYGSGGYSWSLAASGATGAAISFTQAMTLDASGNLLVGTTSGSAKINATQSGTSDVIQTNLGASGSALRVAGSASTMIVSYFTTTSGFAGQITCSGSTTTYAIASDYRLKTVLNAVSGSGERIDALQPIEYEWKADGSRTRGFLAHQFQEVYAGSVSGEKDAIDEKGKPVYQTMQASTSEVIADLVAEIQSLRKRLAAANI